MFRQHNFYQFDHEVWEDLFLGLTVMPLFLFYDGVFPCFCVLTIEVYEDYGKLLACTENPEACFSPLLYLRMIVQGNLLVWTPRSLFVFNTFAVCCCRLSLLLVNIQLHFPFMAGRDNVATPFSSTVHDALGDFTIGGELAEQVDRCVLGDSRDGVFWNETNLSFSPPSHNYKTWMWAAWHSRTVMLGAFAGKIMKEGKATGARWQTLPVVGLVLLAWCYCGVCRCSHQRIRTGSMTLLSGGYGCFRWWRHCSITGLDYKGHTRAALIIER